MENARIKEDALIEEKQKHEKETQHLKKQLSETHEQVLLLKEELHLKNELIEAVQNSKKRLEEQLAKLQQEKQNLVIESEQCKAELVLK